MITMMIAAIPIYSHCPHTSLDSDEVDSSSEPSVPLMTSTTCVTVHLVIGSINWPSNVSSWLDAFRRLSRFLRVSLRVTARGLATTEPEGSVTIPGNILLSPPTTLDRLGESIPTDGPNAYSDNMMRPR